MLKAFEITFSLIALFALSPILIGEMPQNELVALGIAVAAYCKAWALEGRNKAADESERGQR